MTTISSSTGVATRQAQETSYTDAFGELGMDEFLQMMITELRNQDPLNPMDNTQILEQIGQMRGIVASDQLTETLSSTVLGQNLAAANSMLGRIIVALTDDDQWISGAVDRVQIVDGEPRLGLSDYTVGLKNVRTVSETVEESADTETGQSAEADA